jgi:hypothetical protein
MGKAHTELKNEVKELLFAQGPEVVIVDRSTPRRGLAQDRDWPDLEAIGLSFGHVWVEIKVKPDKPSAGQLEKIERLRAAGDTVVVAYRLEDVSQALEEIRNATNHI